jgi:hypothetical protein
MKPVEPLDARTLVQFQREVLAEIREPRKQLLAPQRRLLPVEQAADYLGVSPKTIRNGLGPRAAKPFPVRPVRVAGRVLFRLTDLDRFVDSLKCEGEDGLNETTGVIQNSSLPAGSAHQKVQP